MPTTDDRWGADMAGIGRLYAGLCDRLPQLPKIGTPEREASDAEQAAMCKGLMEQFKASRVAKHEPQ